MTEGRTLNLSNRDDLSYLEAVVDQAPTLSSRADYPDPLSDWWRSVIKGLIEQARRA